jgi:hypothetical protein
LTVVTRVNISLRAPASDSHDIASTTNIDIIRCKGISSSQKGDGNKNIVTTRNVAQGQNLVYQPKNADLTSKVIHELTNMR